MYIWDETKRQSNIEKHGLDFLDAALMYENPDRCTYLSGRPDESRRLDRALVRGEDVRIISFRVAPREERKRHEQDTK